MVNKNQLVIISGFAGAGKTTVLHALEDIGYYAIDNMPAFLLEHFAEGIKAHSVDANKVALTLDSRDPDSPQRLAEVYEKLLNVFDVSLLFLRAKEDVIEKRFKETRRTHPLTLLNSPSILLRKAIEQDEENLQPIMALSPQFIDTTHMTALYLKQLILRQYSPSVSSQHMHVQLVSFGYKYGVPSDLDLLFDARCFRNPYYDAELKHLTGLNTKVKAYVFADPHIETFLNHIEQLIRFLYPLYTHETKRYLTIGIGCTGGQHRSVAVIEEMAKRLQHFIPLLTVEHRHCEKE